MLYSEVQTPPMSGDAIPWAFFVSRGTEPRNPEQILCGVFSLFRA
jgi:hypothetical protein